MIKKTFNEALGIYGHKSFDMIMACFCRSFDEVHLNKDKYHLISSIVYSPVVFSASEYGERIARRCSDDIYYIFVVYANEIEKGIFKSEKSLQGMYSNRVIVMEMTVDEIIDNIFINNGSEYFLNLFGTFNQRNKDFDSICPNSLFLFVGMVWSTVILLFKLRGIEISGGCGSKRHILSTIDFQLNNFLEDIYGDRKLIKTIIYNSLKNSILSNSVPLNLYKSCLDINQKFYPQQFQDIDTLVKHFNVKNEPTPLTILDNYLSKFIINNYYKTFNLLVDNYMSIIQIGIINLTIKIEELKNRLSELKSIETNEDLSNVQFKGENLLRNRNSILDCENEIKNLNSQKSKKENELKQFLDNKTKFSIVELLKLVDLSKLPPKKNFSCKASKIKQDFNRGNNRGYCTINLKIMDRNITSSLLFK